MSCIIKFMLIILAIGLLVVTILTASPVAFIGFGVTVMYLIGSFLKRRS